MNTTARFGAALMLLALAAGTAPASAATDKDCKAKFDAAKAAGTLGTKTYAAFKKSDCAPAPAATTSATTSTAPVTKPAPAATQSTAAGPAVFPTGIAAAYVKESAFKSRLHTCRDQYEHNKAMNANGGLKWIQKGGGYWSQCDHKLAGSKA